MKTIVARALGNKHTSTAGVVFFGVFLITKLAKVWFPHHAAQLEETAQILESAAVLYMGLTAGDARPQKPVEEEEVDTEPVIADKP